MHTDGFEFLRLLLDLELVKLPEDITLAGFTPLMLNPQDPCYVEKTEDMVSHITLYKIDTFIADNKFENVAFLLRRFIKILKFERVLIY